MDFRERKETVAVAAVIYERRLQRRFNPRYLGEIDVASKLAFVFRFKIEFLNFVSVDHHNARFLGVGGINKHFLWHVVRLHVRSAASPGGAAVLETCLFMANSDARQHRPLGPAAVLLMACARVIAFLLRHAVTFGPAHPFKSCAYVDHTAGISRPFPAQSVCFRSGRFGHQTLSQRNSHQVRRVDNVKVLPFR